MALRDPDRHTKANGLARRGQAVEVRGQFTERDVTGARSEQGSVLVSLENVDQQQAALRRPRGGNSGVQVVGPTQAG